MYRALFMLTFGFGEQQAQPLLDAYLQQLLAAGGNSGEDSAVDVVDVAVVAPVRRPKKRGEKRISKQNKINDSVRKYNNKKDEL